VRLVRKCEAELHGTPIARTLRSEQDAASSTRGSRGSETSRAATANVSFHNIPLTNVTLSVNSQVVGGTASHIVCNGQEADTAADGDGSVTLRTLSRRLLA
jgi:hypothetical protein